MMWPIRYSVVILAYRSSFSPYVGRDVACHAFGCISKVSDLTEAIKQINPLKIKDELIHKHSYYEYKMKQFLMALALGMRPARYLMG